MAEMLLESAWEVVAPDISQLVTEDDTPVDNIFSEKQQRLLVDPLYVSWETERPFVAAANVGIFSSTHQPPIVPDMFLSLDVQVAADLWRKEHRSYFLWEFDKAPELVVEIVSNLKGGEAEQKFRRYTRLGVLYYVIFDPQRLIQEEMVQIYQLSLGRYVPKPDQYLERIELGLTLWDGRFEGTQERWLRWCDQEGRLLPTGRERAAQEREWAGQERQRAEQERQRADQEHQRAERLAARLRALGGEPEEAEEKQP